MENRIAAENGAVFYLSPLRLNEISTAKALCDICVGKNLYSEKDLGNTVEDKKQFFWLLKTEDGETAGYIYYKLTDTKALAKYARLDEKILLGVSDSGDKGKIQRTRHCGAAYRICRRPPAKSRCKRGVYGLLESGKRRVFSTCA